MTNAISVHSPLVDSSYGWEEENVTNPDAPNLVLVVDDSAMQRKMLTKALVKWGYDVLEAETGMEGLEICKQQEVTIVISDWMMPGMNGPEFCHAFRQLERQGYGYFILLTSKGESREVAEGLNSGADDFLTKPFIFGELQARLRAGERIVEMHRQLTHKNKVVNDAFETIRKLYDSVQSDLVEARRLQQSLVRETDIAYGGGRIGLMLHPSGHVGGDLVGEFQISPSEVGIYSLDVSGHGVASALMTAQLAGYLSGRSPSQNIALVETGTGTYAARDPAETATALNETMLRELETDHYFTMALATVDLVSGKVKCVQAGHPHPLVIRRDGTLEYFGDGGMPIGLLDAATYETFEFQLNDGDQLLLYSDGVTEAENPQGHQLEEVGLDAILNQRRDMQGLPLLDEIYSRLIEFGGSADFSDDISALIFEKRQH